MRYPFGKAENADADREQDASVKHQPGSENHDCFVRAPQSAMAANTAPASANKLTAAIATPVATPSKPRSSATAESTHEIRDDQSILTEQERTAAVPVLNCCEHFPARSRIDRECVTVGPRLAPPSVEGAMTLDTFSRASMTITAVLLGSSGAYFAFASFDDPASAIYAMLLLIPCAFFIVAMPDKRPRNKSP